MSFYEKSERKYAEKVEKASKVLLVCVYDTVVLNITYDLIRPKFQQFGTIIKMLIFEKGEVTKLFVEYAEIDHAVKAKNKLDGTKLCDTFCKMTIYFSNFSNVEVMNEPAIAQDSYNVYDNMMVDSTFSEKSQNSYSNKSCSVPKYQINDDEIMESFQAFGIKRSKTEDPHFLTAHLQSMTINNFCQVQTTPSNLQKQSEISSPVIWFGYKLSIKPKQIYNLFSNFGNISCVMLKKEKAFIKFRSKEFAAMSFTYLNGKILVGNVMNLHQCPQQSTSWRLTQGEFCECAYFDSSFDRFTSQRSITINPPANTIHVSSIKRDVYLFSKYGEIQKVKILQSSNDKNMALIKFVSIEDSCNAICNLHNQMISGRKLQISFTKSKF